MIWLVAWALTGIASAFISDVLSHKNKGMPWHIFSIKEILLNISLGALLGLIVTGLAIWLWIEHVNQNTDWFNKKVSIIGRKPKEPDSE